MSLTRLPSRERPPETDREELDLLVVGAGVSGLTLAREMVRRRPEWKIRIVEAEDRPGGTMLSDRVAGCLCERGPNGFLTNVSHTWDLAHELGLEDRLRVADERAKRRFLWVRGALREVSASPVAFMRSDILSVKGRLRILLEPFARRSSDADESIRDFAARRIGPEAADLLVDAMVSGIFAGDASKLSLRAALPRMADMEDRHGSLVKAMIALERERKKRGESMGGPAGPGGALVSFDEGMEVLSKALAEDLGSKLRTGEPIREVARTDSGFEVTTSRSTLGARRLVLATPSFAAASLLSRDFPRVAPGLESIPYAGINVVCLSYRREQVAHPLTGFGFLVPRGQGPRMLGCIWTGSIFPDHVDDGRVLLRAMVGGARDPEAVGLAEGALVDLVHDELDGILGGIDGRPADTAVYRWARGIPQYVTGHPAGLTRLDRELAGVPGLYLVGNAYRGVGVNDCVREARAAAERIDTDSLRGRRAASDSEHAVAAARS